jgi:hypothetical protein
MFIVNVQYMRLLKTQKLKIKMVVANRKQCVIEHHESTLEL